MKISDYYRLTGGQSSFEFIDINLLKDNEFFLNPTLIYKSSNPIVKNMARSLRSFNNALINSIINNVRNDSFYLMSGLKEPFETGLGYTKSGFRGKAISIGLANEFIATLRTHMISIIHKSQNGTLGLNDLKLLIPGISNDRISDYSTKIGKKHLIEFTQLQCNLHNIPMQEVQQNDIFNCNSLTWEKNTVILPINPFTLEPFIMVPKDIVSLKGNTSYTVANFIRFSVNNIIIHDSNIIDEIEGTGKNGVILKKDLHKYIGGFSKDSCLKIHSTYSDALDEYSSFVYENILPLSDEELSKMTA